MRAEQTYELFMRGLSLLDSKNPAQAAVVLERARRLEPGKLSIREALGRAYFAAGDFNRARREFLFVVDASPTNRYAHYCLSRCAGKLGDEPMSSRHLSLARAMGYRTG